MHGKLGEAYLVKTAAYNYEFTTAWPSPKLLINTLHQKSDSCLLQSLSEGQIWSLGLVFQASYLKFLHFAQVH